MDVSISRLLANVENYYYRPEAEKYTHPKCIHFVKLSNMNAKSSKIREKETYLEKYLIMYSF